MKDTSFIRIEIDAIMRRFGRVTPEAVREAARDPASPLHDEFTWDDGEAAEAYRLEQARGLIRKIRITVQVEERIVRAVGYIRDPGAEARESGYLRITSITPGSETARDVVVAELARVASALTRARGVADVLDLSGEIDMLLDMVAGLRQTVVKPEPAPTPKPPKGRATVSTVVAAAAKKRGRPRARA